MQRSERNVHPPKLHKEGVVEATDWLAPSIGSTPKRYKRSFFAKPDNCNHPVVVRKNNCTALPMILTDEKGESLNQTKCFRCGKRGVLMYCGGCKLFFCFKNNGKNVDTHSYIAMKNGNVDMHEKNKIYLCKNVMFSH